VRGSKRWFEGDDEEDVEVKTMEKCRARRDAFEVELLVHP
jgi:hypothetical protein